MTNSVVTANEAISSTVNHSILFANKKHEYRFTGSKYQATKGLFTKDIAKLIREDLKQFKGCKFGVKSGINNLDISINSVPFEVKRAATTLELLNNEYATEVYTEEYWELVKQVKAIAEAYNYDDSDSMTDYFNTRFYLFVR